MGRKDMIDALLVHIKDYLLAQNPLTFQKGFSGGRQYQDGKVVVYDNGEGEYVGLGDSFGSYFYLRYIDDIELDVVDETNRTTACKELTGVANVRIVAWVNNANLGKLQEILLTDLMNVNFNTLSATDKQRFSNIKMVTPFSILSDFEQIYKEETLAEDEDMQMVDNVTLTAVDFAVTFNYKENTSCLDRDICVPCS